eukprot:TRINITY_DN9420_c0_g4_i2.p2 TRINITY_DN9420_c0_g4~~TRINITY_DN9420_c0_g4_i2.p2  ORF type:complete len:136 (+),score=38.22 TRINITY_DN9420_c0_g4_i2:673-1080(+)
MLLKLKLDAKQMNLKGKASNQSEGIVVDMQMGEENNFVADSAEAIEEELNVYRELEQSKDIEINFNTFSKVINARALKAKLWSQIEKNKADDEERDMGVMYRTDFGSLFEYIQATQECSPQTLSLIHISEPTRPY